MCRNKGLETGLDHSVGHSDAATVRAVWWDWGVDQMRVIQWNISVRSDQEKIASYLEELIFEGVPTFVCLQEVLQSTYRFVTDRLRPDCSTFSLDSRPPGRNEGKNRRMGLAILAFSASITESGLLTRTVFPERSLWASLHAGGHEVEVLSFHSLTGVGYKKAKASNFASIADSLQEWHSLDFLCFDANEPRRDSLVLEELEFWATNGDDGRNAALIMGADRVHSLEDSFRKYSAGAIADDSVTLPVTHYTRDTPRRYDYIFSSPRWNVTAIAHPYEDSINSSSDHSAVVADFEVWS